MTVAAVAPEKKNGENDIPQQEPRAEQPQTDLMLRPSVALTAGQGFNFANLQEAWWFANQLAKSQFVPDSYKGKAGDCLVAMDLASRLKSSVLAVLQNTYSVHGRPGMEAKFVVGLINSSGQFTDPLDYEIVGDNPRADDYRVRAFAVRKSTGKTLYGPWIDWQVVRGEGWDKKDGSKWKTIPEVMFAYRAASWFANRHCPECKLGMHTTDELADMVHVDSRVVESEDVGGVQGLKGRMMAAGQLPADPKPEQPPQQTEQPGAATEPTPDAVDTTPIAQPTAQPGNQGGHWRCDNEKCQAEFAEPIVKNAGNGQTVELCPHCESLEMTAVAGAWKPTHECHKCHRQYLGQPVACVCGSKLGFKALNAKGGKR